jgi:hypothetical protein
MQLGDENMATKKTATKKTATKAQARAVLVTTAHRGVFFGYLVGEPTKEKVTLTKARNCVSWTAAERGFLGLAEAGPGKGCRIGPSVSELTVWDVTSVALVSAPAVERWEAAQWA